MLHDDTNLFKKHKVPKTLLSSSDFDLSTILSNLNDGAPKILLSRIKEKHPKLKFLKDVKLTNTRLKYNFKEIAEFIQLNVKFV